jgi:TP901 family phage tail tape measure protein
MEADIRKAINRAENSAKINPKVDRSALGREGDKAGKDFASRFASANSRAAKSGGAAVGKAFVGGFAALVAAGGIANVAQTVIDQFRDIVTTGLDFSKTLNNFQGVTRATAEEMARMQSAARALGSDTTLAGASSSDAALAMTELAKAGFSVDEAMRAARGTLELATAGQIGAAQAAEIQSNAMNAFGLSAESAAHTADLFANAAVASSADIPDLGLALSQVGGIAHGFGENLDDTIAALGIFANAGIKGSDAGTLLKTTMQSITDQGNPAQGAIEALNLQLYNFDTHQFVGFRELFRQLDEAKKRLSPEEFQAETNILFGSDAMRAALLGNADAFDEMLGKIERVGGASELAGAQMQGMPGAVEAFKNTVEGIQLDAFETLGPTITTGLNQLVVWMGEHKAEIVGFFVDIAEASLTGAENFARGAGGMLQAIGDLAGGIGNVKGVLDNTMAFFADLRGDDAGAAAFRKSAQEAFGWGESIRAMGDKLANADFDGARDSIRAVGERAADAAKLTTALGGSVAKIPDGKTIVIEDNSPETIERLGALGIAIEQTPTGLKLTAKTDEAQRILDAFRAQQTGQPITPAVKPDLTQADADMQAFRSRWAQWTQTPTVTLPTPPNLPPNTITPADLGGLLGAPPRATGGSIFGPGTGTSDSVPIMASRGEHMWTAAEVDAVGGQADMYRLRALARKGALRGFAGGGEIDLPGGPGTYVVSPDNVMTALQFAQSVSGSQYSYGSAGPTLFDCSGFMSAIYGIVTGQAMPAGQRYFTTESDFSKLGFLPGYDPSSPFNIGVHNGGGGKSSHMAGSVMGYNVESGGSAGITQIGGSAAGPNDPQFENQYHLPGSMASMYGMSGQNGGSYEVDQQEVFDAETRAMKARNDLDVQRKQLAELEAKGTATESQLLAARNDVAEQERDVQSSEAKLAEAKQGKLTKATKESSSGSGGMDGSSLGESIFGGILQSIGLDGSLFSNPFDWPNVKSLMAGLNFGGGLLKSAMGGGEETGSTTTLAGSGGGGLPLIGLPSIADFMKPIGPQALTPNQAPVASGIGTGPVPGPAVVVNGNVGMDPRAFTDRVGAANNASWRKHMGAVKPG